jgi:phosphohistidine swiveling domain-containing protein/glycerol-3-phosphate acyltransferase PlsY
MTLMQVWGSLVILIGCPILGALPLINWIATAFIGRRLDKIGTGNVSVSAAFYHGGKGAGILAVLSEAAKGIIAVLIARYFFPEMPAWELIALIALVMGRYWGGKGAGTTNIVWGIVVHDPIAAVLVFFLSFVSFTIFRDRRTGRLIVLFLLSLIVSLRHPDDPFRIAMAIALSVFVAWIYTQIPDDLDLSETQANEESRKMFRFFQGNQAIPTLNQSLDPQKVGQKAATLSQLKNWGYNVPEGWILPAGDDPQPLIASLQPSPENPLIARSSAVGEDSGTASAAGQYTSVGNITASGELDEAITQVQTSYQGQNARQYRQDRNAAEASIAVLIQKQIPGVFSGVAFSRDPVDQYTSAIAIEALPGDASSVVSGQVTPEQYRVFLPEDTANEKIPEAVKPDSPDEIVIEGNGDVPHNIIREVALLVRDLEKRSRGIPQDIEWTYDGETLWLLQARPITNLRPIWTRKIAAEVIPGAIRPLTWSINRPLTCGVWGEIFTVVLGQRAEGLDFTETATLHFARAYFNATLLGTIFLRMGLPPESLEFLTRGAKFSKPPLWSTLRNIPGLLRLLSREWQVQQDFKQDCRTCFEPILRELAGQKVENLDPSQLGDRIETILDTLTQATYYSILAPLSFSLRQAILKVDDSQLDSTQMPEVESLRSLRQLANETRHLLPMERLNFDSCPSLFAYLADSPDGENILSQFERWLHRYGYLSEAATDIAVPRWLENPRPARQLFTQYLLNPPPEPLKKPPQNQQMRSRIVQSRLNLKGQVTETYSRLLAYLRWSFIALEQQWLKAGILKEAGDIFYLKFPEIQQCIAYPNDEMRSQLQDWVQRRKAQFNKDSQLKSVPFVVYGEKPEYLPSPEIQGDRDRLQGIAASPGIIEGRIKIIHNWQDIGNVDKNTILVVPYTDSGWAPLLARAGGLISEVGGRLSHGAIVAREYGIPAVMDVHNATQLLKDNQKVRLDGQMGVVDVL